MSAESSRTDGNSTGIPARRFVYQGTGRPLRDVSLRTALPAPPPWRDFDGGPVLPAPQEDPPDLDRRLGPVTFVHPRQVDQREVTAVNIALFLRRPLLVTGPPGVGKSTLAYQVSRELRLGPVLRWPVNSRTTLRSGQYEYDAIGRVQEARRRVESHDEEPETDIGDFLHLGPLGTALLPYELPRVLLVDEFDKGDADLANDLLDVLEEGGFTIPELFRVRARAPRVRVHTADPGHAAVVTEGAVRCRAFPFIVITSNRERDFPPAFLRRCVQYEMPVPGPERLADLVTAHFAKAAAPHQDRLIQEFLKYRKHWPLAADQLLNALYLAVQGFPTDPEDEEWRRILEVVLQRLDAATAG
ncbi:AAA family ATPase [Nonomuraea lactucae]|uniref:AAA family ATPase n=1 Tax=Nonomuraea lactucae TaxID=2249762 RepID=UPI000DE292EC|nr:MoxR family ATPase [Nonomuraea lactucae]